MLYMTLMRLPCQLVVIPLSILWSWAPMRLLLLFLLKTYLCLSVICISPSLSLLRAHVHMKVKGSYQASAVMEIWFYPIGAHTLADDQGHLLWLSLFGCHYHPTHNCLFNAKLLISSPTPYRHGACLGSPPRCNSSRHCSGTHVNHCSKAKQKMLAARTFYIKFQSALSVVDCWMSRVGVCNLFQFGSIIHMFY